MCLTPNALVRISQVNRPYITLYNKLCGICKALSMLMFDIQVFPCLILSKAV